MLDVIIYEDDEVSIKKNVGIINKLLIDRDIQYHIHTFKKCNNNFIKLISNTTNKIFIINLESDNNHGIEVATIIRKINYDNIIILTASCRRYYKSVFSKRLMAFDYVCKNTTYDNKLYMAINDALKNIIKDDMFVFTYRRVIYRIPFKNINYIEKESNIKRCIIHTIDNDYYIVSSINKFDGKLKGNFIKTHQSCIVNTDNIKMLDCVNNKAIFNNDSYVTLITENAKKAIKESLFS